VKELVINTYALWIHNEHTAVSHRLHGIHQMDLWEDPVHCMHIQLSPSTMYSLSCYFSICMGITVITSPLHYNTNHFHLIIAHIQESSLHLLLPHTCMYSYRMNVPSQIRLCCMASTHACDQSLYLHITVRVVYMYVPAKQS